VPRHAAHQPRRGGTLYQDIAEQMQGSIKHDYFPFGGQTFKRDHLATRSTSCSTRLAAVFGAGHCA